MKDKERSCRGMALRGNAKALHCRARHRNRQPDVRNNQTKFTHREGVTSLPKHRKEKHDRVYRRLFCRWYVRDIYHQLDGCIQG